jgi:signal transduction histidine kinase
VDFAAPVASPTICDELVRRAVSVATGTPTRALAGLQLSRDSRQMLDASERRARRLAARRGQFAEAAALDFLGAALAGLSANGESPTADARAAVAEAAAALGVEPEAAAFAVYRRSLAGTESGSLPPGLAIELIVSLLRELAPLSDASLWSLDEDGELVCVAAAGDGARGRRLREAARAALDGAVSFSDSVQAVLVERWDRPHAVLVARTRPAFSARCVDYLDEAAAALSPVLERDALYARGSDRERALTADGERRLVRLGFDLHDGPLQELVAFAEDLRLARSQMSGLLADDLQERVRGRFDDLEARLVSLDRGLRDVVGSVRSTTVIELPLETVLQRELDAMDVATELTIDGDVSSLTSSQKIVVFRVVQASLANVRSHSGATRVEVTVRSTSRFITITVVDNGCGFDVEETLENVRLASRYGLAGVTERVQLLGGNVEIESRPEGGTTVRATLPHWCPTTKTTTPLYAVVM